MIRDVIGFRCIYTKVKKNIDIFYNLGLARFCHEVHEKEAIVIELLSFMPQNHYCSFTTTTTTKFLTGFSYYGKTKFIDSSPSRIKCY